AGRCLGRGPEVGAGQASVAFQAKVVGYGPIQAICRGRSKDAITLLPILRTRLTLIGWCKSSHFLKLRGSYTVPRHRLSPAFRPAQTSLVHEGASCRPSVSRDEGRGA